MIKIIKFKKRKVLLGIVFFAIYFAIVIGFIFYPEGMMKHLHTKDKKLVQIPFLIVSIFPFTMLYSYLRILFRKKAIINIHTSSMAGKPDKIKKMKFWPNHLLQMK